MLRLTASEGDELHGKGSTGARGGGCTPIAAMEALLGTTGQTEGPGSRRL